MGGKRQIFLEDTRAVSEEFTSLPALTVVMVGFTLFLVLLANTITGYEERTENLQNYQTAVFILIKFTNPDCSYIRSGGLIDIERLKTDDASLQILMQKYKDSGLNVLLHLCWENTSRDFPQFNITGIYNRIAVSKNVGIYLNDARTVPGTLTIIVWRDSR